MSDNLITDEEFAMGGLGKRKSDTPRTDAACDAVRSDDLLTGELVLSDFARTLELELSACQQELAEAKREFGELLTRTKEGWKQLTKAPGLLKEYEEELDICDRDIRRCEEGGDDWYGINFHQGRRSGIITGNIIESKAKEELTAENSRLQQALADAVKEANEAKERQERSSDMWKGQVSRQSDELTTIRTERDAADSRTRQAQTTNR